MRTRSSLKWMGLAAAATIPLIANALQWPPMCPTILGCDTVVSGNFATASGSDTVASGNYATAMGLETEASGNGAVAMGYATAALGSCAVALGSETLAEGNASFAAGGATTAHGQYSVATGNHTTAYGSCAVAMGSNSYAEGDYAIAMGNDTLAGSFASFAVGRYNVGSGTSDYWLETDPVFEIGNGVSDTSRSNALTVLKNGQIGIRTATPEYPLQVTHISGDDAEPGSGGTVVIGSTTGQNLAMDTNEIMARNNGNTSPLYLQNDGGSLYIGGQLYQSSDARLKEDIRDLDCGLEEVLRLRPVSYKWRGGHRAERNIGLVAQEVEGVVQEVVRKKEGGDGVLTLDYAGLTVLLVNGMRELEEENDAIRQRLEEQQNALKEKKERLEAALAATSRTIDRQRQRIALLREGITAQQRLVDSISRSRSVQPIGARAGSAPVADALEGRSAK